MNWRGRLTGLALILVGFVALGLVLLAWRFQAAYAPSIPLPPGMRPDLVPSFSPLACLLPLCAVGSALLVLEGIRRVIAPD